MMTVFEPLFILLFLAAVVTVITAATLGFRGQRRRAGRILRRLTICAAVYVAIVLLVAGFTHRQVYRVGDLRCFDDWCIAVVDAKRSASNSGASWTVTLRLASRARRVAQRENDAAVYLTDGRGRRFDPVPDAAMVPLDVRLQPGQSVDATRQFELPPDAAHAGLVFTHQGGFPIGSFIIGENEWFHEAAIVRLE